MPPSPPLQPRSDFRAAAALKDELDALEFEAAEAAEHEALDSGAPLEEGGDPAAPKRQWLVGAGTHAAIGDFAVHGYRTTASAAVASERNAGNNNGGHGPSAEGASGKGVGLFRKKAVPGAAGGGAASDDREVLVLMLEPKSKTDHPVKLRLTVDADSLVPKQLPSSTSGGGGVQAVAQTQSPGSASDSGADGNVDGDARKDKGWRPPAGAFAMPGMAAEAALKAGHHKKGSEAAAEARAKATTEKGATANSASAAPVVFAPVFRTLSGFDHDGNAVTFKHVPTKEARPLIRLPLRRWADAWGRYNTYKQRLKEVRTEHASRAPC